MHEKKTILFVNESLACAGGEKSLLNLLSSINYERYDVYLQLLKYGAPWEKYIPKQVHILKPIPYYTFTCLPFFEAIRYTIKNHKYKWFASRYIYSFLLRIVPNQNNLKRALLYWKSQSSCFDKLSMQFDYVIAYAHNWPTFYVADKVKARIKSLAWINATYTPTIYKSYIESKYNCFDTIVAVSEVINGTVSNHFPQLAKKVETFRDLIAPDLIYALAKEPADIKTDANQLTLVTLGRLNPQKGHDIAIKAASILKQRGIKLKWYLLGSGPLEPELKTMIRQYNLTNDFILLGVKENPYPYLKLADIYVQTSRLEGFGLAIAEARLLNIPVVTTRFNTVYMQMVDERNGLVADMNEIDVANAIERLWKDKALYARIVTYLKQEQKGNLDTIPQFYNLLETAPI